MIAPELLRNYIRRGEGDGAGADADARNANIIVDAAEDEEVKTYIKKKYANEFLYLKYNLTSEYDEKWFIIAAHFYEFAFHLLFVRFFTLIYSF